ncbi:MAG: DUF2892 domain-containing protein [Bdellovibrionales bacterium]|nr:DUF2892 domain-containing protein [Bdellovibrionales bacterium]
MEKNLGRFEALARLALGSLLFFYFVIGGPVWTLVGLYLMLTGSFRFCIFYYYLSGKPL